MQDFIFKNHHVVKAEKFISIPLKLLSTVIIKSGLQGMKSRTLSRTFNNFRILYGMHFRQQVGSFHNSHGKRSTCGLTSFDIPPFPDICRKSCTITLTLNSTHTLKYPSQTYAAIFQHRRLQLKPTEHFIHGETSPQDEEAFLCLQNPTSVGGKDSSSTLNPNMYIYTTTKTTNSHLYCHV